MLFHPERAEWTGPSPAGGLRACSCVDLPAAVGPRAMHQFACGWASFNTPVLHDFVSPRHNLCDDAMHPSIWHYLTHQARPPALWLKPGNHLSMVLRHKLWNPPSMNGFDQDPNHQTSSTPSEASPTPSFAAKSVKPLMSMCVQPLASATAQAAY